MDPIVSVLEKVKSFAKSSQDLVSRNFGFHENPSRQNPIEILKRLQREAFSDLMKLRDRQEKVERIISSKLSKGGPFQETSTHVRGEVDVLGAILLMGNTDEESFSGLDRQGVRPGLLSRFMFETSLRETDTLVAELVGGYKRERNHSDVSGSHLSLAKVFYKAEINDWFSAVAIPVGARFRDIEADVVSSYQFWLRYINIIRATSAVLKLEPLSYTMFVVSFCLLVSLPIAYQILLPGFFHHRFSGILSFLTKLQMQLATSVLQGMSLTEVSELGPPLLNQHNGSAVGLTLRMSNITASLAQSISNLEVEQGLNATNRCLRTFGQVTCHIVRGVKISLLGCHQVLTPSNSIHPAGAIAVPVSFLRRRIAIEPESSAPPLEMSRSMNHVSSDSIALKLESLLDECTRIGGWIEIQNLREKQVKWSVSITDNPEDEVGWGMSVGGVVDGPRNDDRFQVESYLKFNIGPRFSLKPGLVYLANSNGRTIAPMLQSHWSL